MLIAAGCGGEELTKEQYVEATAAPLGSIDTALLRLELASPDELGPMAAQTEGALLTAADRLETIDAPEELREAHDLLVDGVRELAAELESLLGGSPDDVEAAVEQIMSLQALEKLDRARERFAQEDVVLEFGSSQPASQ
jgi:hypothetical protein